MRFILGLSLMLGLAWAGYWALGSRAVERGVADWFAGAGAQGITATQEGLAVQGFPNRFDLTVTRPSLADPARGLGWTAPFAQVFAMTWKPWHLIAVLPADQQITLADERIAVTSARMAASLRLSPTAALTFTELVIETQDLVLASDRGWTAGLAAGVLAVARAPDDPRDQRLGLELTDLRPDPALALALPELGPLISRLHLDATLQLTAPLDRALAESQPRLSGVEVRALRLDWGVLHLSGQGAFHAGPDGLAEGDVVLTVTGWQQLPPLAAATGLISPEMAKSLGDGLAALAASDGDPASLTLPLTMADGWMSLGPLPLGPAPALVQRQ